MATFKGTGPAPITTIGVSNKSGRKGTAAPSGATSSITVVRRKPLITRLKPS